MFKPNAFGLYPRQRVAVGAKEGELASDVWWIDASSVARSVRPADGSAGLADGGSGHAAASDHGPTRAATGGYLRDHAVRLRNWGGRHCLRRSCDDQSKASNSNQPNHSAPPLTVQSPTCHSTRMARLSCSISALQAYGTASLRRWSPEGLR